MKNSENKYNKIIDNYYNELPDEVEKTMSIEELVLTDKLNLALDKMDILKSDSSTCPINILAIIEKGETIHQKKKSSLEFLIFISLSLFLISSLILVTLYFGERFFIYYELLTFIFIPVLIIPLAMRSQTGGR